MEHLDDPSRITELRNTIAKKKALRHYYRNVYARYAECLARCPGSGVALELGAGAGFTKEVCSEILTSDILPYAGLDCTLDARDLPFRDGSLRLIAMHNVFHHIPDVAAFLREAARCLRPGGRMLIVDQHPGLISKPILTRFHHEPFNMQRPHWEFETSGPLSGANGALAWIVFSRDKARFERDFPLLRMHGYRAHTPLYYWLAGGLKHWTLIPGFLIQAAEKLDRTIIQLAPKLGSFVDVEIERLPDEQAADTRLLPVESP